MDHGHTNDERDDDELTVPEAADYLHLMITRVMELCEDGTVGRPITTPNGTDWLIRRSELDAYAEQLLAQFGARQQSLWPGDNGPAHEHH